MATFVLMTKLAPSAVGDAESMKVGGRAWLEKIRKHVPGIRFISHYAIFGAYDFMDIYEVDQVEEAQKVALVSRWEGAVSVETWQALPYDHFLELLEGLT